MATLNLGRIKPVFQGAYNNSTAYVVDDIVTFGNETFICILASTGNATSNATYWTKLAAKGTDGTDVGTTLTTQGDILYRDASGLQRLPKGTAGQVLKMNAGATAPEYGTLSSDYVKIATQTVSSAVASINFDNSVVDFSTYKSLVVVFSGVSFASDGGDLGMRLSSNNGSSLINCTGQTTYNQMNGSSSGSDNNHGFHPFSVDTESDNDDGFSGQATITSFSSGNWSYSWGFSVNQHQNGDYYRYENACVHQENSQPNYIRFYEFGSGQNIDQGEFILYGRK